MKNDTKKEILLKNKKKLKKGRKFRDTVLVRVSRDIKEEIKAESKRTYETMSQIADRALKEYLNSVKPLS